MEAEKLDVFNEDMEHVGTDTRREVHQKGLWHQTFHLWIVSNHDGKERIIFQKRAECKKDFPNKLDITSAGHLLAGESESDGVREVDEEIGISVSFDRLSLIGVIKQQISVGTSYFDNEFCHTYLYHTNLPLTSYKLQEDEVSGLVTFEINHLLRLFSGEIEYVVGNGVINKEVVKDIRVTREDLVPHSSEYYVKVLDYAKQFFHNNTFQK